MVKNEIFRVEGDDRLIRTLSGLKKSVAKTILGKAVRAGSKSILKQAKANAPKNTGALRRSLTTVVRRYKSGVVAAVIGPRKGGKTYKATKRKAERTEDAYYGIMVEGGTKPHPLFAAVTLRSGKQVFIRNHPGTRPTFFLKKAMLGKQNQAKAAFYSKAWDEIEKKVRKASVK